MKQFYLKPILFAVLTGLVVGSSSIFADDAERVVVIYLSNGRVQAGFPADSSPRIDMPGVIGTSSSSGPMIGMRRPTIYYGSDAENRAGVKKIQAVNGSVVSDWNAFEKLISYILRTRLSADPETTAIVMNEPSSKPASNREKMTQMFFETFRVPGFFMSPLFTSWNSMKIAGTATFKETFITKDEYDEHGPSIIHRKSK